MKMGVAVLVVAFLAAGCGFDNGPADNDAAGGSGGRADASGNGADATSGTATDSRTGTGGGGSNVADGDSGTVPESGRGDWAGTPDGAPPDSGRGDSAGTPDGAPPDSSWGDSPGAPDGAPKGAIVVGRTRTEYRVNPIGIDVKNPRYDWVLTSSIRGQRQTAYQLVVASTEDVLRADRGDLWDSGKVASDQSIQVVYGGTPLASRQRAYWKVRVWDKDDRPSEFSAPAWWEAGLLAPADWSGKWIASAGTTPATGAGVGGPAPYFRKNFSVTQAVRRARVYATALGAYEISLNGKRIGADHFLPGWTDFSKRLQYQTYDVTASMVTGENVLGVIVGDGWFAGKVGWYARGSVYGPGPIRARLQLELELADGTKQTIASDETWRSRTGPILFSDIMDGETYDARLELPGWDSAGFNEAGWSAARAITDTSTRKLVADATPHVEVTQELDAQAMTEITPGVFIFDLRQNMVGWVRLRVQGAAGRTATLRFAEVLNPDGTMYTANLRAARATETYTLRGGAEEVYEPHFTFHGFRYVELSGEVTRPTLASVTGIVAHSALPVTGTFTTSASLVNQLQSNIVWGQRGNFFSVPTDCPQRDERLGWMGDALIFARTATFNMDVASFYTKWLRDVDDGQNAAGVFNAVSPPMAPLAGGAPAWSDAGVFVPWTMYLAYGDTRVLEEHYPAMTRWIESVRAANPNLLWQQQRGNDYGDWLSIADDTDKEVLATAFFAHSVDLVSRTARLLKNDVDGKKYEDLFLAIKNAFNTAYVSAAGNIRSDTQTVYALALQFGLLPDALRAAAGRFLTANVTRHTGHLSTGFVGVSHLLPALTSQGNLDLAYQLLNSDTYPSWGYAIRRGATTIWERWDGQKPDGSFQDPGMNSFNHYSFGSVGEWMYAVVAGIELDDPGTSPTSSESGPGYKAFRIRPRPGGGLTSATGKLDSIHGTILSDWKIENGTFTLKVEIPVNTSAVVYLPFNNNVRESGLNPPPPTANGGYALGSGTYVFTATP